MEVKIIQGNKSVLGAFHRKVKKLRVAAYRESAQMMKIRLKVIIL